MLDGQTVGHSTGVEAPLRVTLIPSRLNLIGFELSLMRAIGRPAARMGLLVGPTNLLQNNAWGRAAREVTPHNLPIAAPQSLDDLGT